MWMKGAVAEWCCFPCQHPHHGSPCAQHKTGMGNMFSTHSHFGEVDQFHLIVIDGRDRTVLKITYKK